MLKRNRFLGLALFAALAAVTARAGQSPDDIKANWNSATLGDNQFVRLKEVVSDDWPSIKEGAENCILFTVDLEFIDAGSENAEELVTVGFGIIDSEGAMLTPFKMDTITKTGKYVFRWDLNGNDGKRLPDGIYRLLVVMSGKKHGAILREGIFPANLASKAPTLSNGVIYDADAVLEIGGAPTLTFTVDALSLLSYYVINADDKEVRKMTSVYEPGDYELNAVLTTKDGVPIPPGKYRILLVAQNRAGTSNSIIFEYALTKPPPLEASAWLLGDGRLKFQDGEYTNFMIKLNQNATAVIEHIHTAGGTSYVYPSSPEKPKVTLGKGEQKLYWSPQSDGGAAALDGEHYFRITAENLYGEKAVAETNTLVVYRPEKKRPTLTLEPAELLYGGPMASRITITVPENSSLVALTLHDGNGRQLRKIYPDDYRESVRVNAGTYRYNLNAADLDTGNYTVRLIVDGERLEEMLSIYWRRK